MAFAILYNLTQTQEILQIAMSGHTIFRVGKFDVPFFKFSPTVTARG